MRCGNNPTEPLDPITLAAIEHFRTYLESHTVKASHVPDQTRTWTQADLDALIGRQVEVCIGGPVYGGTVTAARVEQHGGKQAVLLILDGHDEHPVMWRLGAPGVAAAWVTVLGEQEAGR